MNQRKMIFCSLAGYLVLYFFSFLVFVEERTQLEEDLIPDKAATIDEYVINHNLPKGWYISSAPIITASWKGDGGNKWTLSFGGGVGKIFRRDVD